MEQEIKSNQKTKPTAFDYGWVLFWLVTSIFCAVMLPYAVFLIMQDQSNLDKNGEIATGVVSDKKTKIMSGGGDRETIRYEVTFKVPDGREVKFIEPRPLDVSVGQKVKVKYTLSGDSIHDAQIITESSDNVNYMQWGILSCLALMFGVIALFCARRLLRMVTGKWQE